jgi:hypothetical protein
MEFSSLISWYRLDEFILFFSSLAQKRKKKKETPTHIAHIAKATQANATTKALSKSAIFPTRLRTVPSKLTIFSI